MARHGNYPLGGENPPRSTYYDQGKFGRLFPTLPPFASDSPSIRNALKELGKAGGLMDANDRQVAADAGVPSSDPALAQKMITDPRLLVKNPDNTRMTAGMTFFGQFLDHDLTLDPTSSFERQVDPEAIQNFRTPAFELDNVYGGGPNATPHLYDQNVDRGLTTLLIEENTAAVPFSARGFKRYDLPRNSQGTALIGDPRNDENTMLSQFQVAMIKFHNAVVVHLKGEGLRNPNEIFAEAQRLVRWHYQWIILHEFLPLTVGQNVVEDILKNGRKFYKWRNAAFIPVEFAVAAYRFGHSQVRPSYRMNFGDPANLLFPNPAPPIFRMIFDPSLDENAEDPNDLRGGKRAARRFIDWQTFFDFNDGRVRNNKIIDAKLSSVLFDLLGFSQKGEIPSLAQRNLLRHLTFSLPSGQNVAKAMKQAPLSVVDLGELKSLHLESRTPLWFYILKEAEIQNKGHFLGAVGGRIVAEVFIGILQGDALAYLKQDPTWLPTLPSEEVDTFKITDLLKFAGVVANVNPPS